MSPSTEYPLAITDINTVCQAKRSHLRLACQPRVPPNTGFCCCDARSIVPECRMTSAVRVERPGMLFSWRGASVQRSQM
jgi:hypothetical protein